MSQASPIRKSLDEADIVPLTLSLVHLTGDMALLEQIAPHVKGPWAHQAKVPEALAAALRDRLAALLAQGAPAGVAIADLPAAQLLRMMAVAVGEPVPPDYVPMLVENMLLAPEVKVRDVPPPAKDAPLEVAVIGAGASGLCAAIRLKQEGLACTVFEKNDEVGGTWYENRYPGCAVDTPNHFYQFSFEPNDDWPHYFSRQQNIQEYLVRCSHKYGVRDAIRFGCEIASAAYDEASTLWTLAGRDKAGQAFQVQARFVVCAVGQLNRPAIPALPGLDAFRGAVLHTATWPEKADLRGKRVGLVGTGASSVQVGPAIVNDVRSLHVFQRSAAWVGRRVNVDAAVSDGKKWALHHVPFYAAWYRVQLFWAFGDGLHRALRIDPAWKGGNESLNAMNATIREAMVRHIQRELAGRDDLIRKLTPDYPPFGKRVLADAGWYAMFKRDNVRLVDAGIARVEPDAVVTQAGERIGLDALVFATGFQAGRMLWPMDVKGRGGVSVRELWGDDNPRAYLGMSVPRFPNFFILYGPNTNLGHGGSAIFLAECQVHYIVDLLRQLRAAGKAGEVREDVHDRYNALIDEKLKGLAWSHPAVRTWYKNASGRIVTNQPWTLLEYWQLTRQPKLADYILH